MFLNSCLTAIKNHVINYSETVFERNGKNLFWSVKNSGEILNKLKSKSCLASGVFTYDFSTLYTTYQSPRSRSQANIKRKIYWKILL